MRDSDLTTCARRRRAQEVAGVCLAGVLLVGLTACGSQRASTRSAGGRLERGVPVSSSSAPGSSSGPLDSTAPMSCYAVSVRQPK